MDKEIKVLSQQEMTDLLERKNLGHLGCIDGKEPYVVPVTYAIDTDYIYSHSPEGKKIFLMRENPAVCLQVEEAQGLFQWKSVIVWGEYQELKGNEASVGMRLLLKKLNFQADGSSSLQMDFDAILEKSIIYRIKIKKMTGRSLG